MVRKSVLFCFFIFIYLLYCIFFFSSRRRHTRYWRDWSSDVCSSDLGFPIKVCFSFSCIFLFFFSQNMSRSPTEQKTKLNYPLRAKWPMESALSPVSVVLSGWESLTPPGWDTNPSQVSSQKTLILIYLLRKDGKLSWLRRKRKPHKYPNLDRARTQAFVVAKQILLAAPTTPTQTIS